MSESIITTRAEINSDISRGLIAALNAELSGLYSEPGANHFRLDPTEVAAGRGAFIIIWLDGAPVGCGALRVLPPSVPGSRGQEYSAPGEAGSGGSAGSGGGGGGATWGNGGKTAELKRMYVSPAVRGRGLGHKLVAALEDEARALGVKELVLETGTRQTAALKLYQSNGFRQIPLYGEYCLSPDTSVCMGKEI